MYLKSKNFNFLCHRGVKNKFLVRPQLHYYYNYHEDLKKKGDLRNSLVLLGVTLL